MLQLGPTRLSNIEIIALGINIQKVITKATLTLDERKKLEIFYIQFEETLSSFIDAFDRHKNIFPEEKHELQNIRREIFIGLKFTIKAYLYSQDNEQKKIAEKIEKIIRKHAWNISNYTANEQTAKIAVILEEINKRSSNEEINSINARDWIKTLINSQNEFVACSVKFSILNSGKTKSPSDLRLKLNEVLKKLINSLPYQNEMTPSVNLDELITTIDKVIAEALTSVKKKQIKNKLR